MHHSLRLSQRYTLTWLVALGFSRRPCLLIRKTVQRVSQVQDRPPMPFQALGNPGYLYRTQIQETRSCSNQAVFQTCLLETGCITQHVLFFGVCMRAPLCCDLRIANSQHHYVSSSPWIRYCYNAVESHAGKQFTCRRARVLPHLERCQMKSNITCCNVGSHVIIGHNVNGLRL